MDREERREGGEREGGRKGRGRGRRRTKRGRGMGNGGGGGEREGGYIIC